MADVRYEIVSGAFRVTVRKIGAQLSSFVNDETGREYIWQADPTVWGSSAPVLFPIVGRLKGDSYELDGRRYSMPQHGIVRQREFERVQSTESSVTLQCSADQDSRTSYPFEFELQVAFRLFGARLVVDYSVRNNGEVSMPFSLGSHPAFALAEDADGVQDYTIQFASAETLDLHHIEQQLFNGNVTRRFLDNARELALHADSFDHDALVFRNIASNTVSLVHKRHGRMVAVDTGGAPHLGIWSKPGAHYICIEPWHGYADAADSTTQLRDKPALKWLDPGYSFDSSIGISVF